MAWHHICFECPSGKWFVFLRVNFWHHRINAGKFQPKMLQTSCLSCTPGMYGTLRKGRIESPCITCPLGYFQSLQGANVCWSCSKAEEANIKHTHCFKGCSAGKYARCKGKLCDTLRCTSCIPGKYAPKSGALVCSPCRSGRYNAQKGQSSCRDCAVGHASLAKNTPLLMLSCTRCYRGTYALGGSPACSFCGPGLFQNDTGQASCLSCPKNTIAVKSGSSHCAACRCVAESFHISYYSDFLPCIQKRAIFTNCTSAEIFAYKITFSIHCRPRGQCVLRVGL